MKSKTIFSFYTDHLRLLVEKGIIAINNYEHPLYICPICQSRYTSVEDPDNPLTLEDAPPKSLGGKPVVLTCKNCNNTAGYKIDAHLVERLREIDDQKFLPGTDVAVTIKLGDETFRANINVDEKGIMSVLHSNKNNHPEKLKAAMEKLHKGERINADFLKSRVIPENLEYALLKTAYILAFQKYGYSLMLDPCFDIVREQLQHPEAAIYPSGFWFSPSKDQVRPGVFMVTDKGLESMMVIFSVHTGKTEHIFVVILPLPIRHVAEVISKINGLYEQTHQFVFTLYPDVQKLDQFLTDLPNIKAMRDWIAKRTPNWPV